MPPVPGHQGKSNAAYDSTSINFATYGALCMLIPAYEVLQAGYNVIYFDLDIGLVQDPVPFLLKGNADFVVSPETRGCFETYPSIT